MTVRPAVTVSKSTPVCVTSGFSPRSRRRMGPGHGRPRQGVEQPTPEGHEDSGGVMAGAAWYSGAAFCPGIGQVQGMRHFVEHTSYTGIVQAIMQDPEPRTGDDQRRLCSDPSSDAVTNHAY